MYGEHQASFTFLNQNWALVLRKSYLETGLQRMYLSKHENKEKGIFLRQGAMGEEIENNWWQERLVFHFILQRLNIYTTCIYTQYVSLGCLSLKPALLDSQRKKKTGDL